jgi:hypothetical protein
MIFCVSKYFTLEVFKKCIKTNPINIHTNSRILLMTATKMPIEGLSTNEPIIRYKLASRVPSSIGIKKVKFKTKELSA